MATPAGVRRASLHVQEGQAVRVRDLADVPAVLAADSDQTMADLAAVAVQGSAEDHTVPATAPMRPRMARHVTPRR
jgi:hypothetical protein